MTQQSSRATADSNVVYLDYNASAPLRLEALEAMLPHLRSVGNASSVHAYGRTAEQAADMARRQVGALIGCNPNELIFTSGATEANNLALHLASHRGGIVTSSVEHPAILETAQALAKQGIAPHVEVRVDSHGRLDLAAVDEALSTGRVGLVSVMAANNETGIITDLLTITAMAHEAGALVHTDATQAVGRMPISVSELDVDLLSLSAHKFGGPQGTGALFIRRASRIEQRPLLYGGGHERGWRAGTTNVPGVVGMGAAAAQCKNDLEYEATRVRALRERLESALVSRIEGTWINGYHTARLPGTSSITFQNAPADAVMAAMPNIAVSNGSACHSGAPSPSHVLLAMGLSRDDADSTLRYSLGYATTDSDVDTAVTATVKAVRNVRALLLPDQRESASPGPAHLVDDPKTVLREGKRS